MGRARHKLTATGIKSAGPGILQDGAGLILLRTASGGSWVWRFQRDGRRRDMGLGSYPDLSLAQARVARDRWAAVLETGLDPIAERERIREAERAEAARLDPTLGELAERVYEAVSAAHRDGGARTPWLGPLRNHILPKLAERPVSGITAQDLVAAFRPIWQSKAPTAGHAMVRLAVIYRKGRRMGLPCDPEVIEVARELLGPQHHESAHVAATPWQEVPDLYARLDNGSSMHLALRLLILTAVRSGALAGMRFSEVEGDVWTIPADRMKGRKGKVAPFRVPLSAPALELLAEAREVAPGDLVFPGPRDGAITIRGTRYALDLLGEAGRPHGFRTSFRMWVQDTGACSYDVAETVLAHKVGGAVERSYARSDLLQERRIVMAKWAAHVTRQPLLMPVGLAARRIG